MANYAVTDIITHATAGDPIRATLAAGNTNAIIMIGGTKVELTQNLQVVSIVNGNKVTTSTDSSSIDLGTRFTANQVLDSESLRGAVTAGLIVCDAGTVALSKQVTSA